MSRPSPVIENTFISIEQGYGRDSAIEVCNQMIKESKAQAHRETKRLLEVFRKNRSYND